MEETYGVIYKLRGNISYQQLTNWTFRPYMALFELY